MVENLAAGSSDPARALQSFERRRKERADGFVLAALRLGRMAQIESAAGRWLRDRLLGLTPASVTQAQLVRSLRFEM